MMKNAVSTFCNVLHRTKSLSGNLLESPLKRCLTMPELILFGIGTMASSGIYVLSGTVVKNIAGPATFISYFLAGIAACLAALCYAELSARIPRAGSAYVFTYVILGEFWAFFVGWNIVLEYTIGTASVASAWSGTLDHALVNGSITKWVANTIGEIHVEFFNKTPDILGAGIVILAAIFIACGVSVSVKVTSLLTVANICIMGIAIGLGFDKGSIDNLTNPDGDGFLVYGIGGVISGAATVFYAFVGFDCMAMASEEVKEPRKTIPISIIVSMVVVTIIYILMSFVLSMLEPFNVVSTTAAFPMAFEKRGIIWAKYLVAAASLMGMSTSIIALLYSLPRVIYAMAVDGLFFRVFGKVDPVKQTPVIATLVFGILAAILALLFDIEVLAEFLSMGTLIAYGFVAISVIVVRYKISTGIPTGNGHECVEHSYNIGKVRHNFKKYKCLNFFDKFPSGHCVLAVIVVMVAFMFGIVILGLRFTDTLLKSAWCIVLMSAMVAIVLACIFIIAIHEQNDNFNTFKTPVVPLTPAISLFLDICLIVRLSPFTWVRLLIWASIGFLIYFFYGIHHSIEGKHRREATENESSSFTSSIGNGVHVRYNSTEQVVQLKAFASDDIPSEIVPDMDADYDNSDTKPILNKKK